MYLLRRGARSAAAGSSLQCLWCGPVHRQLAVQSNAITEQHELATMLIVGRPNVGKSTLFNRLTGRRNALVHDTPSSHVTRDYKEGLARFSDLKFHIIDTSGLEPAMSADSVQGRATRITQQVRLLCILAPNTPRTLSSSLHHAVAMSSVNCSDSFTAA